MIKTRRGSVRHRAALNAVFALISFTTSKTRGLAFCRVSGMLYLEALRSFEQSFLQVVITYSAWSV